MEKKSEKKIIDTLYKEIERKDKIIKNLKEENMALVKTALKASEKQNRAEKALEKHK